MFQQPRVIIIIIIIIIIAQDKSLTQIIINKIIM